MPTLRDKRAAFREMHRSGCFVIPNPWDVGSALFLQRAGFEALATTSAGYAWSQGRADGRVPLPAVIEHLKAMSAAVDVPINADFESGFGADPAAVAKSVRQAVAAGVSGLSIEDSTGDPAAPLRNVADAVARLQAARSAIDEAGGEVLLVGRAENFLVGRPDLEDTVRRLRAYAEAGADCLFAPGLQDPQQLAVLVRALAPKPVNVLVGANSPLTLEQLRALGVRRISVGGGLARCAWGGFAGAVRALAAGRFDGFTGAMAHGDLNALFADRED
ncbi:MAG: 2-methylisocitrate lyase [Polyangiaceae bacterium UTPRO1]|jgi:2-methylisocitrate lyase-like PEP mutase family enzyme|nr:isocitrate lyase/phosphoenolpyruvate mutase family protein [Myxococcales bacterium]OQY67109.1 MAG: 2-methylisocitrate lyase [Polyangiaceae bacterium UTPRO1]